MLAATLLVAPGVLAQAPKLVAARDTPDRSTLSSQKVDIRIDPRKPFVYLVPIRVGARQPLKEHEPDQGIYFQLVNNCRLPITVMAFKRPEDRTRAFTGLENEIVDNARERGAESVGSVVMIDKDVKPYPELLDHPNEHEAQQREAVRKASQPRAGRAERPHGYNSGFQPGFEVLMLLLPGEKIDFSVPKNHIGEGWHFEVPFRFALTEESGMRQPYNYIPFFLTDLPKAMRESLEK
ncbi:MAG TPA: hypothetical protein VN622_12235 [Clostridia bacterium]|nr:hypothetical protein [Clostridia bacterium]